MSSSASSPNAANRSSVPHASSGRQAIRGGLFKALKRTFRHRMLLGLLCLISLGMGYLAARVYGTSLWEANLSLLYLYRGEAGAKLALPMVLNRTTHPALINAAIAKVDANLSKRTVERNFSATAFPTSNYILLKLKWSDPHTAKELLSAMVVPLQDSLKEPQGASAGTNGDNKADRLAKLDGEIAKLRQEKREDLKNVGVHDFARQTAEIKDSIASLESYLQADRVKEVATKEQYKEVLRQLDDLKKSAAQEADEAVDEGAMMDSIADNRRRQQRIRELLLDEKERIDSTASLEAKTNEKKQLEELIKQGKGNRESLIHLDSEIFVLKAKLQGSRAVVDLDNELRKIDHLIVPKKKEKKMPTSPVITQMLDKKMDRELTLLGLTQEINHLQQEVESQRAKLAYLTGIEGKLDGFDQKMASLERERAALQSQPSIPTNEAPMVIPYGEPSTDQFPVSSNRPTIFATIFLSGSGLSILAVLLYELIMGIRLPADVAKSLRIPVRWIAVNPAHAAADYRDLCRGVRSQGFLAKTILQIQSLNQGAEARTKTAQAVEGLAQAFTVRGEKVLIVDLGQSDPETAGLSDLLLAADEPIERFIQPNTDSGISRMIAGRQRLSATQMADSSLRTLLEKVLQTYQVILLHGQGLQVTREVEALGLATDGLALVSNGNRKIDPIAREALLDLTAENLVARALIIV